MFNLFYKNSPLRESLAAILLMAMIFSAGGWVLFYPKPAQAMVGIPDIIGGPANIVANVRDAAKWAWEKVQAAYAYAADQIKTAYIWWQKSNTLLARASRVAAQITLHTVLNMLTNDLVKWIQGGGEPRFISDWEGFLKEAGDKAGGLFVDKYLGAGWLCEPFDVDIKIALLRVPSFDERVKCTISDIVENIHDFYEDFRAGGWQGWIELTKPKNNLYGAYLIAHNEKIRLEDAAEEAAEKEGISGRGFLSIKVCTKGKIVNNYDGSTYSTCNDTESCKSAKESVEGDMDYSFECEKEKVSTPGSVLSDVTSRALDRSMDTLSRQVADLTDSLGQFAPYIIAVSNALINRLLKEGLAAIKTSGPSSENPSEPLPASTPTAELETPAGALLAQDQATFLVEQQMLLKENLETRLLPQQQSNLSVMHGLENIQNNILVTLADIFEEPNCSLPSWASSQIIDTITEPGPPIQVIKTIQITASGIGSILIKETSWTEWDPNAGEYGEYVTYHVYENIESSSQISSQITGLEEDIGETNQWISDTATAIASTNGFIDAVDGYIALYDATLQPPTEEEQAALDAKKEEVNTANDLLISDGQTITDSSAEDIVQLSNDTQETNMTVNQTTDNLLQARGMSEQYPQEDTLYAQKQSLQAKLSQAQTHLSNCQAESTEPLGGI